MKKTIAFLIICVVLLSPSACGGAKTQATAEPAQTVQEPVATSASQPQTSAADKQRAYLLSLILFWDNFQDGNTLGWTVDSGWDVQQDGEIYNFQSQTDGAAYLPFGVDWSDYVYRALAKVDGGGVAFNYMLSSAGRYIILYHEGGLYLAKEAPFENLVVLAETDAPPLGEWHWFAIAMQGGHIQVYVDRTLALDYTDPDPLTNGTAGVGSADGPNVSVDDVLIHKRVKALPAAPASFTQVTDPSGAQVTQVETILTQGNNAPDPADVAQSSGDAPVIDGSILLSESVISANGVEADTVQVDAGQPVVIAWDVGLSSEVYLDGEPVPSVGSFVVNPTEDTTYVVESTDLLGETYSLPLTIDLP